MINTEFLQETAGAGQAAVTLDATALITDEYYDSLREDIKQNSMVYEFPEGLNQVDILEECRALTMLEDFDTWFDLTMQMLAGKPAHISLIERDGTKTLLCAFQVTGRHMDLRGVDAIAKFPWLVVWMVEFIKSHVSKKFPLPGKNQSRQQAAENEGDRKAKKKAAGQTAT